MAKLKRGEIANFKVGDILVKKSIHLDYYSKIEILAVDTYYYRYLILEEDSEEWKPYIGRSQSLLIQDLDRYYFKQIDTAQIWRETLNQP